MAWSYFTSLLDGSRFITKLERDELYAAFTERVAAAGLSGSLSVSSAIQNSGLITDLILKDGSPLRMLSVMNEIGAAYVHPQYRTTVASGTLSVGFIGSAGQAAAGTVIGVAATNLGLTYSQAEELSYDVTRADHHQRWNLIRECLRVLSHLQVGVGSSTSYVRNATAFAWSTARDAFVSSFEGAGTPDSQAYVTTNLSGIYSIAGNRPLQSITIPAYLSIGYVLKGWRSTGVSTGGLVGVVRQLGSSGFSAYLGSTGSNWEFDSILGPPARFVTGTIAVNIELEPYIFPAALDGLEPTLGAPNQSVSLQYHNACVEPLFTHP